MNAVKVLNTSAKVIFATGVAIGSTVWANDKVDEYMEKHEMDTAYDVVCGLGYSMFVGGLSGVATTVVTNALFNGVDAWTTIGVKVVKALSAVKAV